MLIIQDWLKGMGYQYNCFIEDDMKRYSMPQWKKKPIDLRHVDSLKIDKKFCESKVDEYGINLSDKSDNGSFA
uniref:Arginine decarboxylase n=1 Tax=Strongyloides venezuelensis TaxID=75913 RepID=A0A0K0FEH9_STRVS